MTHQYTLLREEVMGFVLGCCVRCGDYASLEAGHCHHRKLRSRGGQDDAWNCVWLCSSDHEWVHANVQASTDVGLMCPSWESPKVWPYQGREGGWFQPTPEGIREVQHSDGTQVVPSPYGDVEPPWGMAK